jgi:hypothetical protein
VVGYTREWERGTFSITGKKKKNIKDFQFCLPIQKNKKNCSRGGDYTWVGKGYFFDTGKKFKDFQFCLPILPAYLPLKFPNGQFPLKIPGPISQAKLKPKLRFYLKIAFG